MESFWKDGSYKPSTKNDGDEAEDQLEKLKLLLRRSNLYTSTILHITKIAQNKRLRKLNSHANKNNPLEKEKEANRKKANRKIDKFSRPIYKDWFNKNLFNSNLEKYQYMNVLFLLNEIVRKVSKKSRGGTWGQDHWSHQDETSNFNYNNFVLEWPQEISTPLKIKIDTFTETPSCNFKKEKYKATKRNIYKLSSTSGASPLRKTAKTLSYGVLSDETRIVHEIVNKLICDVESSIQEEIDAKRKEKEKKRFQAFDINMDKVIDSILDRINTDQFDLLENENDGKVLQGEKIAANSATEINIVLNSLEDQVFGSILSHDLSEAAIKDAEPQNKQLKTKRAVSKACDENTSSDQCLVKDNNQHDSPIADKNKNSENKTAVANCTDKKKILQPPTGDFSSRPIKYIKHPDETVISVPQCFVEKEEEKSSKIVDVDYQQSLNGSQSSNKVPCPICTLLVSESKINAHLDFCISGTSRKKSLRRKSHICNENYKRPKMGRRKNHSMCSSERIEQNLSKKPASLGDLTNIVNGRSSRNVNKGPKDGLGNTKKNKDSKENVEVLIVETIKKNSANSAGNLQKNREQNKALIATTKSEIFQRTSVIPDIVQQINECKPEKSTEEICPASKREEAPTKIHEEQLPVIQEEIKNNVSKTWDKSGTDVGKTSTNDDASVITSLIKDISIAESIISDCNTDSDDSELSDNFEVPTTVRRSSRRSAVVRKSYKIDSSSDDSDYEGETEALVHLPKRKPKTSTKAKKNDVSDDDYIANKDPNPSISGVTKIEEGENNEEYKKGDRIFVKWNTKGNKEKNYKAKILDITEKNGTKSYLVHYLGWEKEFDEWVTEGDVIGRTSKPGRELPSQINETDLLKEKFYLPTAKDLREMDSKMEITEDGKRYYNNMLVSPLQPELLSGGILRDYQVDGFNWMFTMYSSGENGILADEMGLGKTIQCIAVICEIIKSKIKGPFLVVAPVSTLQTWFEEFKKFAPRIPLLMYHGTAEERNFLSLCMIQTDLALKTHPVVITSYDVFMRDYSGLQVQFWRYLVLDEGHRIKNMKCKLLKLLNNIKVQSKILLTGTPLQNSLSELWSLLNFLLPELFDDLDTFQYWFNFKSLQKDKSLLTMAHKIITPFILRRMKTDVCMEIASKCEVIIYTKLSEKQEEMYRAAVDKTILHFLKNKNYYKENADKIYYDNVEFNQNLPADYLDGDVRLTRSKIKREIIIISLQYELTVVLEPQCRNTEATTGDSDQDSIVNVTLTNVMMMLRKCSNHPYLIEYPLHPGSDLLRIDEELILSSGKLQLLDKILPRLIESGHKTLIFSQMTKMLDILEDYCQLRSYKCNRLDGAMSRIERNINIHEFTNDPTTSVFLLSTRAGGLGINLVSADTVIIFDSDWNPQCDRQAQDRCHRLGQTKPVIIYRFVTPGTIDQEIVERAHKKKVFEELIMHKKMFKGSLEKDLKGTSLDPQQLLEHLNSINDNFIGSGMQTGSITKEVLNTLLNRRFIKGSIEDGSYEKINQKRKGCFKILK